MCGIAGIFFLKGALNPKDCHSFIDALSHRGPDGRGTYFEEKLFLGHRRLKILDITEAAKQPMHSQDGRFTLVFNGEIYNFLELRRELEAAGYRFFSNSDSEVILASFNHWGEACQHKFNGMWAFAIWDHKEQSLFLSRDRFGVKPLYIYREGECFAFASELKAFRVLPFVDLDFDEQNVANAIEDPLFLEPSRKTLFKKIEKVQAGSCLKVDRNGELFPYKWWDTLSYISDPIEEGTASVERFRALFFEACSLRMRSDVPLGTALSGGLDSSSILCSIFELGKRSLERWPASWQKSFTASFPHSSHSELEYAELALNKVQAEKTILTISPSALTEHLEDTLFAIEDIFDPPVGPWLLYREYRKRNIPISIDGHGADELLCGYHHQFETALLESLFSSFKIKEFKILWPFFKEMHSVCAEQKMPKLVKSLGRRALQLAFSEQKGTLYEILRKVYWGRWRDFSGYGRYGWLKIPPVLLDVDRKKVETSQQFQKLSPLNRLLYRDFHFRTLPSILRNFDRSSMSHGVEIRAPFLDWKLVTFAFSLPSKAKAGPLGTKTVLREAMRGILPEEIRLRKSKIGFACPLDQWIQSDLKEYILDIVASQSFQQSSIWDGPKINQALQKALAGGRFLELRKAWEYVLADRLLFLYKNSRALCR